MTSPPRSCVRLALAGVVLLVVTGCGSRDARSRAKGLAAVGRARAAQAEVFAADARDHQALATWLRRAAGRDAPEWPTWRRAAIERIASDRTGYQGLLDALRDARAAHDASAEPGQRELLAQRMGSVPLRAEIGRLLGNDHGLPGLLTEATKLLEGSTDARSLLADASTGHASAVRKVAAIYAALATRRGATLGSLDPPLAGSLTLAYPAAVPQAFGGHASGLGLSATGPDGATVLLFPNVGYVFGGVPQGDVNRGMECGAFVSWVHRLPMSWWSGGLEAVAKARLAGALPEDAPGWMKSGWGSFDVVREEDPLRPGDIVVWRWDGEDGERVGHIVLCTQATEASPTFLGLETCRFDDGSLEGIVERRHARQVEGRTTWVLRVR